MDVTLVMGTVGVPLMIAILNFVVRYLGKLGISPSSDLLLVLLCLDMANLVSMDFFKAVVQSEVVKTNLQAIVLTLMFLTLITWLVNILAIERKYQDRLSEPALSLVFGKIDMAKILLLGISFVFSVVVFGLHIGIILYKSVEG